MDFDTESILNVAQVILVHLACKAAARVKQRQQSRHRTTRRRLWCKPWILHRERQGAYPNLCRELRYEDAPAFANFARFAPQAFEELLSMVTPLIARRNTNFRDCISPGERLMVTLRFLATGETFQSLSYQFRIGCSTIREIVPETCMAIHQVLCEKYLKCPNTMSEWLKIADGFKNNWQFPHCLGALDGKHIAIRPPPNSGSVYYNYKHFNSIVLMALVNSNYKFLYIDIGCNGRVSDGGVFRGCTLQESLERQTANIPPPSPLPGSQRDVPFFIVADEAFPLKPYIMKPYARRGLTDEQRLYNYRLSRARRVVENAFGILANQWRILFSTINQTPQVVENIVLACCVLHNYLREERSAVYEVPESTPDTWTQDPTLRQAVLPGSTNPTQQAKITREILTDYFNSVNEDAM